MKYLVQLLLRRVDVWKVGVTEEFFDVSRFRPQLFITCGGGQRE